VVLAVARWVALAMATGKKFRGRQAWCHPGPGYYAKPAPPPHEKSCKRWDWEQEHPGIDSAEDVVLACQDCCGYHKEQCEKSHPPDYCDGLFKTCMMGCDEGEGNPHAGWDVSQ